MAKVPPKPGNGSRQYRSKKVVWSLLERKLLAAEALKIQAEHPELSNLPLLRAAQKSLPPNRRRKIVSMAQASWFEDEVRLELERRTAVEASLLKPHLDILGKIHDEVVLIRRKLYETE